MATTKTEKCSLSAMASNMAADAVTRLLDGGTLRIYDGRRPATADTAITGQTLLAELIFSRPAFEAAVDGVAKARTVTPDQSANGGGEATWFRASRVGAKPVAVCDGDVGLLGSDTACLLMRHTTTIQPGAIVRVDSLRYIQPKQPKSETKVEK